MTSDHGMMLENSIANAFQPDWVEVERATRINSSLPSQLSSQSLRRIGYVKVNSEFGDRPIGIAAERVTRVAEGMLASFPRSKAVSPPSKESERS